MSTLFTSVNADHVRLAHAFISREQARYYLMGVAIQKHPEKGAYIVSTDGHRLACFYDETGVVNQDHILVLSKECIAFIKRFKKPCELFFHYTETKNILTQICIDREHYDAGEYEWEGFSSAIDGTFPEWKRVIPRDVVGHEAAPGFNPKYLGDFKEICEGIKIFSKSDNAPALVMGDRDDFVGVLMPMRMGLGNTISLPDWLV